MRHLGIATAITFLGLFVSACGGAPTSPVPVDAGEDRFQGEDHPAAVDVPVIVDVATAIDNGALEAGGFDTARADLPEPVDTPLDTSGPCASDDACAGSALGPVCDNATGRCVPCTPTTDRCPAGQYCVAGMNRCASGCRNDAGCTGSTPRCNPTTHACVACLDNGGCSLSAVCVGNECVSACSASRPCPAGQGCCLAGCADTQSSTENCGGCGTRCVAPNATPTCRSGVCGVGSCTAPFANCDGDAANGCETDLRTSVTACGACGTPCASRANSAANCDAGTCRYTCTSGFGDCDGSAANGCETDTSTTPAHCGMCGRSCALPNATAGCALGACTVAACTPGFGNCNGNAADGCEVDVRAGIANCGTCGRVCTLANTSTVCSGGTCAINTCNAGFGNCDGDPSNGCEASLSTPAHCGMCGAACPTPTGPRTVSRCASTGGSATCGVACESGWRDCDSNLTNGCEVTGSCTVERALYSDNFMTGAANWILSNDGTAAFGMSYSQGYCRNPASCFGCAVCIAASSYCPSQATATLRTTFDFSRVVSGTFSFYSLGSPGASDRFIVQATTNGGASWTSLSTPLPSACCIDSASAQRVDLTPLAGARSVQFRFLFDNQCDGERFGTTWYVDDVTITVLERTY